MATKKELTQLPKTRAGVKETANVRMILMAAPRCPIVDDENDPRYTGEANCQTETGSAPGWWTLCEERGHDPYFSNAQTIKVVPVVEERDGKHMVTGEEKQVIVRRRLNTVRVPVYTRTGGMSTLQRSRVLKGRKFLEELGFAPVCEFRNCEYPVQLKTKYGAFCGERHARLIGADVEGIMLHAASRSEKNKQLNALDLREDGSGVRLQTPPDIQEEQVPV